jgi:hypothetical protein
MEIATRQITDEEQSASNLCAFPGGAPKAASGSQRTG